MHCDSFPRSLEFQRLSHQGEKPQTKLEGKLVKSEGESVRSKEEEGGNYTAGGKQGLWNSTLTVKPENYMLKGKAQQNPGHRRSLSPKHGKPRDSQM